ncbi:cisplatin damage response ATP-dependent DNA ligase [Allorhizobium borbori]|uniref:DNA ligase (ATP) n=1 Tax=Allorhizobium borbori TaxID=485907 RepID=A0A7W6K6J7_9HYPH|nr:cisplatin damage response ATP-dependent DNA ligase [Allorhizobium borbori]MBB4104927.1 DNA ligase-1 [Allorhizobium borbori]
MRRFAHLLDRLLVTPSRNGKLALLSEYFRTAPDPDRGYGLAALAGTLTLKSVKPALIRELVAERMDPILFQWSYDYVGDLAETVSLVWKPEGEPGDPGLGETIEAMNALGRTEVRGFVRAMLDRLETSPRFAFIKLVTGGLRIGVSGRLARQALADAFGRGVDDLEAVWHGVSPPYGDLFAWLEGRTAELTIESPAVFRSPMLATPVGEGDLEKLDPADFAAEWKWDGIRIQLVKSGATCRLYSRSGDDISAAFPEVLADDTFEGVIDGELLIGGTARSNAATRTFSDLQQRLNRKTVTRKLIDEFPAFIRAYDLLDEGGVDRRDLPFGERRQRLEDVVSRLPHDRFDLSPLVSFTGWDELDRLRSTPPDPVIEGVMMKRWDSPYQAGRAKGPWFKWKRNPYNVDAVLLYAQRGHGKRSGYYSDFTFGLWRDGEAGPELVPVGKAYFGFTDAELEVLDRFVRENTVERFGPVRSVRAEPGFGFVVELAFEGIQRSTRHRSGVALRFPRIARLRADKLPADADRLAVLEAMLPP